MILLHLSAYFTSSFVKNFPEDGQCRSKHVGVLCAYKFVFIYCCVIVGVDLVSPNFS